MTTRFLAAILVLAFLEMAGLLSVGQSTTFDVMDPVFVNAAGRQQLVIREIDALAHHFEYVDDESVRSALQDELHVEVEEMQGLTAQLTNADHSKEIRQVLFGSPTHLADRMEEFAGAALVLATTAAGSISDRENATDRIAAETERLGTDIGDLTDVFEREHRAAHLKSRLVTRAGSGLKFFLLAVIWMTMLRPMEKSLTRAVRRAEDGERYFRHLVEYAYDTVSVVDPDGKLRYITPSFERVTGFRASEVESRTALDLIHPEDHAQVAGVLAALIEAPEGTVMNTEFRVVTKSGEARYLEAIGTNLVDNSEVGGVVVNSRDVTDRRLVEEELKTYKNELEDRVRRRTEELASINYMLAGEIERREKAQATLAGREKRFRSILERASDAIFIQNATADGLRASYSEVNEAACRVLGYNREELLSMSPQDIVVGFSELPQEAFAWMEDGARTHVVEMTLLTRDGRHIPFEARLDVVELAEGDVIICLARDISDRKAAEETIRRQNAELEARVEERTSQLEARTAQLEAANEDLQAFAYSVSHDLRAPIRAMIGFSENILRSAPALDEKDRHGLERIHANAVKMGALVSDLLAYAMVGRTSQRKIRIDVSSMIPEVLEEIPGSEGVNVHIDDMPALHADPTLLRQVYQNLLSNAVKFTRGSANPSIRIGATYQGGHPVYFVRDNGVGFDMKYADKLFGVFQRLHRADEFEGTGVGLAIVDRIVRRGGGRIWAESRPDEGASFYISFDNHAG